MTQIQKTTSKTTREILTQITLMIRERGWDENGTPLFTQPWDDHIESLLNICLPLINPIFENADDEIMDELGYDTIGALHDELLGIAQDSTLATFNDINEFINNL